MASLIRLDKLLGHSGFGTRKEIKGLCKSGVVTIDGRSCLDSAAKLDPEKQTVVVDGTPVTYARFHYLMLHKPAGVVSATRDPQAKTVLDLLPQQYGGAGLFPVGRLDKDTTGLLLLTNDGVWAHRITAPKKDINKVYEAQVEGHIPADINERFQRGIELTDMVCLPATAEQIAADVLQITVHEGKFHQVKRMCAALDLQVQTLKRLRIGALALDEKLAPGSFRVLTEDEKGLPFL
jgi:16S rRNA pseudouridine516 synthase